jgi:hypothetical protein
MYRAMLVLVVVASLGVCGCVQRRFLVESDPPGAFVYLNGQLLGATPCETPFVYYGAYDLVLVKDGFKTMKVRQDIRPPWYERFPVDFFSENLYPGHLQDNRAFRFQLEPVPQPDPNELLMRAGQLRERGQAVPSSSPAPDPPPAPQP